MRCWLGRLGLRAWPGETGATLLSRAKARQRPFGGGSGVVPGVCGYQPRGLQGEPGPGRPEAAAPPALFGAGRRGVGTRGFSGSAKGRGGGEDEPGGRVPPSAGDPAGLPGKRRRGAWERPLSPLERVSRMLPEDLLSSEVRAIRGAEEVEAQPEGEEARRPESVASPPLAGFHPGAESDPDRGSASEELRRARSKNFPFQIGDLILAEIRRRRGAEFKKLCKLATAAGVLNSSWGVVRYAEILGKLPGQMFLTSAGHPLLIRRPALEEFVLLMKRGPTISYPKDINAMLLLMDISQGDTVLEVGSGSGGMSLFLSRAVGPQGHVISYEVRRDHHRVAKKNYQTWCDAWRIGHTVEWPNNVDFINADILAAAEDLKTITFDAIALDMVLPQNALPTVIPNLKHGGVCAVYLANITQVIDLVEAIRTNNSTLFCERIVEVTHRDWLILPTTWRNGGIFRKRERKQDFDNKSDGHYENDETSEEERDHDEAFVSDSAKPPYIARPYPWQTGHTAFLVKLRKFNPANTVPNGTC